MLKVRVIPCLLLKGEGLVKTVKFKDSKYVGDPINAVKIFNEKEVDELMLLDISATVEKKSPHMKLISKIASECFMPLCYGGGVRTLDQIKELFELGVEKVSLNSCAVETPSLVSDAARLFGCQSIVASIDVKKSLLGRYEVFIRGGRIGTKLDPVRFAVAMEEAGAGEILLNSIDRDGTMAGYDVELIKKVTEAVKVPVIASGGAGKLDDFRFAVKSGRASAVAAGSFFVFQGKYRAVLISYPPISQLEKALT